jgi:hypothetical protein
MMYILVSLKMYIYNFKNTKLSKLLKFITYVHKYNNVIIIIFLQIFYNIFMLKYFLFRLYNKNVYKRTIFYFITISITDPL